MSENGKLGLNAGTWPALPLRTITGLPKIRHLMAERRKTYTEVTELTNRIRQSARS